MNYTNGGWVGVWIPSGMWVFTWLKKIYTARTQFFSSPCKTKAIKQFQFEIKNDAKSLVTQLIPIAVSNGDIQDSNNPTPIKTTELFKIGNKEWQTGKQLASKTFRNNKTKM